jgi:hypothetical protein
MLQRLSDLLERTNGVLQIRLSEPTSDPIPPQNLSTRDDIERHLSVWRELRELRSLMGRIVDV